MATKHYYVEGFDRPLDQQILGTIARYLAWGLDCGNFGMLLLTRDDRPSDLAATRLYTSASDHLRPAHYYHTGALGPDDLFGGKNDIVANLLAFVKEVVPEEARGSQENYWAWCRHDGFRGLEKSQLVHMKLTGKYQWMEDVLKEQGYSRIWAD